MAHGGYLMVCLKRFAFVFRSGTEEQKRESYFISRSVGHLPSSAFLYLISPPTDLLKAFVNPEIRYEEREKEEEKDIDFK